LPDKLAPGAVMTPEAAIWPLTISLAFRVTVVPLWLSSELARLALPPLVWKSGMNAAVHPVVEAQTISLACSWAPTMAAEQNASRQNPVRS